MPRRGQLAGIGVSEGDRLADGLVLVAEVHKPPRLPETTSVAAAGLLPSSSSIRVLVRWVILRCDCLKNAEGVRCNNR